MDIRLLHPKDSPPESQISLLIQDILHSLGILDPLQVVESKSGDNEREGACSNGTVIRMDGREIVLDTAPGQTQRVPFQERLRYEIANALGRKTVLFVCSGNAVRSQIAEGIVNHFFKGEWAAFSAGVMSMNIPKALLKVMREIEIDISAQRPKHVDTFTGCAFDRVVILCSDAGRMCPTLPDCKHQELIVFHDPLTSDLNAVFPFGLRSALRRLRDEMKAKLIPYMEERKLDS